MLIPHGARNVWRVASTLVAACIWITPSAAHAYTIKNALSEGCHEKITSAALRTVRQELPAAAALATTEDEKALVDDLQFVADPDMRDLGGATLLIAVRDNDLKGRGSLDVAQLAAVHGSPDGQEEHCLRGSTQDEPGGSAEAVAACRAFIRGRIAEALDGLDAAGIPDPAKRTTLTVHLALRGQTDAPLPTYYVKMGQAIHAIEDSFTHTYRTPDEMEITVVLNWIDKVSGNFDESRDGPAHAKELDRCDDPDTARTAKRVTATDAVTALLRATLASGMTSAQKMTAVDGVLDMYLRYSPGCTFANNWCNAPERIYADAGGCGCRIGQAQGGVGAMLGAGLIAMGTVARRARRRRRGATVSAALAIAGLLLVDSGTARAQAPPATTTTTVVPADTPATPPTTATTITTPKTTTTIVTTPTGPDAKGPPAPTIVPVKEPGPRDPNAMAWGAFFGASGAVDNPALAVTAGGRMRASKHWALGLDGEWNPWIAFQGSGVRAGVINVYATGILRFPLAYENFNLRTSLSLGTSYLLTNLYGAPSGSFGLYGGLSFLGLEWKVSRTFYAIINPIGIVLPVPQLKGVPLAYPQYRLSLGIEIYLG
jgi:MYXO-CTERM domain-containing protein